jgi:signal transduction histidine kinase
MGDVKSSMESNFERTCGEEWAAEEPFLSPSCWNELPVAVFCLDRCGRILAATEFAVGILEAEFAVTAGRSVHEIPSWGNEPGLSSIFMRTLNSKVGEHCKGVFSSKNSSGEARYYEAVGTRLHRALSAPTAVISFHEVTEHFQIQKRLERSGNQLRSLSARLQTIREEERKRLSRIVHDELGQTLTLLEMGIASLKSRMLEAPQAALITADQAAGHVKFLLQRVRRIASELRPPILDEFGLAAAIQWQAREFEASTGIACSVNVCELPPQVTDSMQITFFRILQEALTNTLRHACATKVRVRLSVQGSRLVLSVCDNGRGISAAELASVGAIGLLGMRERAANIGGECEISAAPGSGVRVIVKSPRLSGRAKNPQASYAPWK